MKKILLAVMAVLFVGVGFAYVGVVAYTPTQKDLDLAVSLSVQFERVVEERWESFRREALDFLINLSTKTNKAKDKYVYKCIASFIERRYFCEKCKTEPTESPYDIRVDLSNIASALSDYSRDISPLPTYDGLVKIEETSDLQKLLGVFFSVVPSHPLDQGYYYIDYYGSFVLLAPSSNELCNFQSSSFGEVETFLETNTIETVKSSLLDSCDGEWGKYYIYVYNY